MQTHVPRSSGRQSRSMRAVSRLALCMLGAILLSSCALPGASRDQWERALGEGHWFDQLGPQTQREVAYLSPSLPYLSYQAVPAALAPQDLSDISALSRPRLSPGDRLRLWLATPSLNSHQLDPVHAAFSGVFEIDVDGQLKLPYLPPLAAAGKHQETLEQAIAQALEQARLFRPGMARVSLGLQQWAAVSVSVSGAVFNPGQVTINRLNAEERAEQQNHSGGDLPLERLLPQALLGAGGVRPDADLRQVELIREGKVYRVDISGLLQGYPVTPLPLMAGDQIRVPSLGAPREELIRPSAITPPGIRVFISNLIVPAYNNASGAVERHATGLPYGSRLHTAVVSGNCAGGAASTNSDRYAVLVTRDPLTQRPITIEREIEALLRAPDRVDLNPYLLPNDSLVCYDSRVSNLRDIGRTLTDILSPLSLLF